MGPRWAASLVPVDNPPGGYRVRWSWPQPRFADSCFLAICPAEPKPADNLREMAAHFRVLIDRQGWEAGGGARLLATDPAWTGAWVVVWTVVDLGFQSFPSPPLVLGRIKSRSRWNWKGWGMFGPRRRLPPNIRPQEGGL